MEKGSQRTSLKSLGEILPIVILTLSAMLVAIAAAGRDPGRTVHEAVMMKLRAVDVHHASLQRDVLRARAGLLPSYDPLVRSVVNLRQTTFELEELFMKPKFQGDRNLHQLLATLREGIDRDEQLVEDFKTHNALLQNSIALFGQTLSSLHESRDDVVRKAISRVSDLGVLMMSFSTRPDDELQEKINIRLQQLSDLDTATPVLEDWATIVIHAKMILAVLPKVDAKIAAIQASPTPFRAERLQGEYLNIAADATSRAEISRILLSLTAVVLCVYICVLVYRLRAQAKRLRRRLQYEQVIAEIKTQMVNSEPRTFAQFVAGALETISCLFCAKKCSFVIYNVDRADIKESFQPPDEDNIKAPLMEFGLDLKRGKTPSTLHFRNGVAQRKLVRQCRFSGPSDGSRSGLIVGADLTEQDVAALVLVFGEGRHTVTADDKQLLQATLQTFIEFIDINRNRQEREGLEHRLEHAQRLEAIGTLAGGIAHEFNNVLAAILGYGEMAFQLLRKPSTTRQYVQEILKSGARAKHIVDQILTFSRKRERTIKPFDVADAVADILPLLQVTLGNHVVIESQLCQEPAVVEGNPVEIHQLTMNLCKNASHASGRGQTVYLSVGLEAVRRRRVLSHGELLPDDYVCLAVQDEGQGIPEHVFPHIFEPFFTTNAESGGSGLGLAAVHGIVTALGGSINVTSSPGYGSKFELYLKRSGLPPLPIESFFNERAVPIGSGERIVIVEQDEMLLELYEEKVAALGYEPVGCSSLDALKIRLHAGLGADLVIIDARTQVQEDDLTSLTAAVEADRFLVLAERTADLKPAFQCLRHRILKTPFSSAALAKAIFDSLTASPSAAVDP